jgi:two-component system, cell cycle response regulator
MQDVFKNATVICRYPGQRERLGSRASTPLTLRTRLTLFFIAIVVVPIVVAGFLVRSAITDEVDRRTDIALRGQQQALDAAWQGQADVAATLTHLAAQRVAAIIGPGADPSGVDAELAAALPAIRAEGGLDYVVVERGGRTPAGSLRPPRFLRGSGLPPISASTVIAPGRLSALFILDSVPVTGPSGEVATVVGGMFVDLPEVQILSRKAGGVRFELVVSGRTVAASGERVAVIPTSGGGGVTLAGGIRAVFSRIGPGSKATDQTGLVLMTDLQGDVTGLRDAVLLVLFGSVLIATGLGYAMARAVSEPIRRLADQASAMLADSPELALEVGQAVGERQGDEVETVASTLSAISEHLHHAAAELDHSREELRQSLLRLGSTLHSTHDMHGMLSAVLDAAAVALRARSGAVYLLDENGDRLFAEVSRGMEPADLEMRLGEGIAGTAASERRTVLVPSPAGQIRASAEPIETTAVAVPLASGERIIGAIALYGRTSGEQFSTKDSVSLAAFARETGVAVANVLRHEQAERLSMTDALTGTGNRRSLEVTLTKEIERARRYGRSISVLMVDIDRFKRINDDFGHTTGDQVLVEVSRRIEDSVRSGIDSVVRYGGEEFVVVLPETDQAGARAAGERVRATVADGLFTQWESDALLDLTDETERGAPSIHLTLSVGSASFPLGGQEADELVHAADLAMYIAKAKGGNRVATWEPTG